MGVHDVSIRIGAKDHASKVFKRVALAAGAFLSFRAIGRFAKQSTAAFIEQEKSTIKLAAALKATGNAAGFTQKQLSEYADELQDATTIGNEAFESTMSVMATFRNVQDDIFKESIMMAADVSQALGQDLQGATIQLGKALNDPITGISALSRVGITFSETQKEQIKLFQETNDLASAQRVILDELGNQFGGQAMAQANSFGGSIKQMSNAFGDLKERLGESIAKIPGFSTGIKVATAVFQNFGLAADIVWLQMKLSAIDFWEDFKHLFSTQIPNLFQWFMRNWKDVFTTIWNGTKSIVGNMGKNIWNFFKAVTGWLKGDGFNFEWTGLLEGFENTLKEMPDLGGRTMTKLETELAAKLAESQRRLGEKIAAKLAGGGVSAAGTGGGAGAGLAAASAAATKQGGIAANESRFLTFGRTQASTAQQSLKEQQKATKQRERQELLQERMTAHLLTLTQNVATVTNFG